MRDIILIPSGLIKSYDYLLSLYDWRDGLTPEQIRRVEPMTVYRWNRSALQDELRQHNKSGFVYTPSPYWGESWEDAQNRWRRYA